MLERLSARLGDLVVAGGSAPGPFVSSRRGPAGVPQGGGASLGVAGAADDELATRGLSSTGTLPGPLASPSVLSALGRLTRPLSITGGLTTHRIRTEAPGIPNSGAAAGGAVRSGGWDVEISPRTTPPPHHPHAAVSPLRSPSRPPGATLRLPVDIPQVPSLSPTITPLYHRPLAPAPAAPAPLDLDTSWAILPLPLIYSHSLIILSLVYLSSGCVRSLYDGLSKRACCDRVPHGQISSESIYIRLKKPRCTLALGLFESLGSRGEESWADPFLMCDEFGSNNPEDYIAGFPSHPHRGFETITYMLAGEFEHRDHMGSVGRLSAGGVQWMTAGRGHSFWMPLMKRADFKDLAESATGREDEASGIPSFLSLEMIPTIRVGRAEIKVIAGALQSDDGHQVTGPVRGVATDPTFFDVSIQPGQEPLRWAQWIQPGFYNPTMRGFCPPAPAARPIHEPVCQDGPFVMNTPEEIAQAFADYEAGTLCGW
ncbi:putative pirin family protein [Paratrimastix pyriformis]|uniref:Pirin family protein n=1 Tax=Paratrimastix pyriformis TaxID=342808 RepID=A0ABQ8UHU7_9EUKA|nr:putative pirin family protein [Paratrimastix pyriformis]